MAMTTAGVSSVHQPALFRILLKSVTKVALVLTILVTLIGMCLALFNPLAALIASLSTLQFGLFEAAIVLGVGAMGLGGIGCKNRCLMMTYIVLAIIGIVIYTLYGFAFAVEISNYDHSRAGSEEEGFQERKDKRMINLIAWLIALIINQILTAVAVFYYFKARREVTEQIYNEFYAQNAVSPVAYSPYQPYGYPAYHGQAYPAPYYYQ